MFSCVSGCQNTTQEYTEQEDKCMSLGKILSIDKGAGGLNFWQGPRGDEPEVPSLV